MTTRREQVLSGFSGQEYKYICCSNILNLGIDWAKYRMGLMVTTPVLNLDVSRKIGSNLKGTVRPRVLSNHEKVFGV